MLCDCCKPKEDDAKPDPPYPVQKEIKQPWRIIAEWDDGREFIVTLGSSEADCLERISYALSDFTPNETLQIRDAWIQEWNVKLHKWITIKIVARKAYRKYPAIPFIRWSK